MKELYTNPKFTSVASVSVISKNKIVIAQTHDTAQLQGNMHTSGVNVSYESTSQALQLHGLLHTDTNINPLSHHYITDGTA